METEIFVRFGIFVARKLTFLINIGYAVSFLCYLIIYLKIQVGKEHTPFRRYLLWYFGGAMLSSVVMCAYHPYYNYWILFVAKTITFFPLVILTGFIIREFWFSAYEKK